MASQANSANIKHLEKYNTYPSQTISKKQQRENDKMKKKAMELGLTSVTFRNLNYQEILEQWRHITKEIGADIQVLDMPLLNTNATHGDLTGVFVADLVLQILAYVAETEREFIRHRQAEGIAAVRTRGVKFGPKKKKVPEEFEKYYALWRLGKLRMREAAEGAGMSYSTFYRRSLEKEGREVKR